MDTRHLAAALALLAVVLLVLNFTVDGAGTLILLLAVACAVGAGFLLTAGRAQDG